MTVCVLVCVCPCVCVRLCAVPILLATVAFPRCSAVIENSCRIMTGLHRLGSVLAELAHGPASPPFSKLCVCVGMHNPHEIRQDRGRPCEHHIYVFGMHKIARTLRGVGRRVPEGLTSKTMNR